MKPVIGQVITSPRVSNHYFLTGYISPEEESLDKKGTIFWIIELTSPETEKIAHLILRRFKKYYLQKEDGIWGFETTIKKINSRLAKEVQKKNIQWVNHLNAILGLVHENTLHLAPTGDVIAYLFRDTRISNILEVQESPPPMHTFISVISGEIHPKDKIFLATSEFSSHITIESLADYLGLPSSKTLVEIANFLRERGVKNINALLLDCSSEKLTIDTVYLDQAPEGNFKIFIKTIEKGLDRTKNLINYVCGKIGNFEIKMWHKYLANKEKGTEESEEEKKTLPSALKIMGAQKTKLMATFLKKAYSLSKANRKIVILILASVILLALIGTVIWGKNKSSTKASLENFQKAKALVDEAKDKKATNQKEDAIRKLIEAQQILSSLKNISSISSQVEDLERFIAQELNTLEDTIQISPLTSPIIDLGPEGIETSKIIYLENSLLTFNKNGNQFLKINLSDSKKETLFYISQLWGSPQDATLIEELGIVFIKTQNNQFYIYNLRDKKISEAKKAESFDWPNSKELLSYLDRVYFLTSNGVWRSSFSAAGFQKPSSPVSTSFEPKSFAIDGAIYLLDNNVKKYVGGKEQTDFSLKLPFYIDLSSAKKIYTSEKENLIFIYLKDRNSIVKFDKTGEYKGRFLLPNQWGEVQDFIGNGSDKLYILAQNKIYSLNY